MTTKAQTLLPLPDPPEREPEAMTSFQHLAKNGNLHHLIQFLGNPDTTIVEGERFIVLEPGTPAFERLVPDLVIAFEVDPATYREDNGYVISRQGKPPDFIMEIASPQHPRTGRPNQTRPVRQPGRCGVLAVRRDASAARSQTGRRPAGGRPIRANRHPGGRGWSPAGLQRRAGPDHPVGARSSPLARPRNGAGNTNLRAGARSQVGRTGSQIGRARSQIGGGNPGQGAGSGTGPEERRRIDRTAN